MNGGPAASGRVGAYVNPKSDAGSWFMCWSSSNLLRRYETRTTPMVVGEKMWVSWATKFCERSSWPTGKPGTLAPAVESGSVVGPLLNMYRKFKVSEGVR